MDKRVIEVEDLICDESFIAYHRQLSLEASTYWNNWIKEHPDQISKVIEAKEFLDTLSVCLTDSEFEYEQKRFLDALDISREEIPQSETPRLVPLWARWAVAAGLLLAGAAYLYQTNVHHQEAKHASVESPQKNNVVWNEVQAEFGRMKKVGFPDGSKVILAGGSTLRYPRIPREDSVLVLLDGEAQFEVAKNPQRVFTVQTKFAEVSVLGTKFLVEQRGAEANQVSLFSGSVRLNSVGSKSSAVLKPDEKGIIEVGKDIVVSSFDPEKSSNFEDGKMVFQHASFEDIAFKFKAFYNVSLSKSSQLKGWSFSGEFKNMTVEQCLEAICFVKGLKYKKTTSDHYVLY